MSQQATFIASIINIACFGLTTLLSIVGLGCSRIAINQQFFVTFYLLIILTSLLQITIGVLNLLPEYLFPTATVLLYTQQLINNFSLISQLAIILTIAYGWSIISSKLREEYEHSLATFQRTRVNYQVAVAVMFALVAVVTAGVGVYIGIEGKTLPLVGDVVELLVYSGVLVASFIQFYQGRRLSKLLNEYKRAIGIKISKLRFNLIYIVAFLLVLLRSAVEITRLVLLIIGVSLSPFWSSATYFIVYTLVEVVPLALYLIGIQVERSKEEIGERAMRESIISESTDRRTSDDHGKRRDTEMV